MPSTFTVVQRDHDPLLELFGEPVSPQTKYSANTTGLIRAALYSR